MSRLATDIRAGWDAPVDHLLTGTLVALAVTAPTICVLALATPLGVGGATAAAMAPQLAGTYAVAGREARRRNR